MNCGDCPFSRSYVSFGGHRRTFYGVKCKINNETLFQVNQDEARLMGVELLEDYRDSDEWYPGPVSSISLNRIMPGLFTSWREIFGDDRVAFFKDVILAHPCICSPEDIKYFIEEGQERSRELCKKISTLSDELTSHQQDIDDAIRLLA